MLQIPKTMFNVIFGVARSVGWLVHWREMMSDPVIRIGRPRQLYVGPHPRDFDPSPKEAEMN
jgi:citrate synthase